MTVGVTIELSGYEGILVFGAAIARVHEVRGWGRRVWTWHEAADARRFHPLERERDDDSVWIGARGNGKRSVEPVRMPIEPRRHYLPRLGNGLLRS